METLVAVLSFIGLVAAWAVLPIRKPDSEPVASE